MSSGGKPFALAVGRIKGFGMSGFVLGPHVEMQDAAINSPGLIFFNLESLFFKASFRFPRPKITQQQ